MTRIAIVDEKLCKPEKCQLECINVCPVNKMGQECIILNEGKNLALIAAQLCTGCGICVKKCPFHAITIVNLVAPVEEKLVFSYGDNAFRLYGLALPRKGIIGIVGENGCGKTTNVKILTGELKAQREPTVEIRDYLAQKHDSVLKPQELASPNLGKVGKLLEKIGGPRMDEIKELFDLELIWNREFKQLSGGELQKVIIAASLLREKETYILDEPFAFLDYAYRIRLIEYLRENFSQKSVLVVDHDLSLLSYLCDHVYLLYGAPSAYGIVSQSYATERGINMFLEGFIDPENVRFRDEPLKFRTNTEEKKREPSFYLEECELKKGTFKVKNEKPLQLFKGEVVGVVGRNGIGKSTLVSHFAEEYSASFKPQILTRSSALAGSFMASDSPFREQFIRHMNLKKLEFVPLSNLSGGELQKMEVFRALSKDTQFYVLDEPTNMMDVAGRMILSKMLREKAKEDTTILVVDHDLEFIMNTVDRLIVLDGEPAKSGRVQGIYSKGEGITELLSAFGLSYRRDQENQRLKLNKQGSVKDRELKESGRFVE